METKNIINNYSVSLVTMINSLTATVNILGDNADENRATMKTLNVILESLRSQITIIQQAVDDYNE